MTRAATTMLLLPVLFGCACSMAHRPDGDAGTTVDSAANMDAAVVLDSGVGSDADAPCDPHPPEILRLRCSAEALAICQAWADRAAGGETAHTACVEGRADCQMGDNCLDDGVYPPVSCMCGTTECLEGSVCVGDGSERRCIRACGS